MTSTIKVNNVQNQCGQNIINENSNTITIGASGDTIALASGASQTGFGRTGTVDWQTGSIKTTTFTAANGEGYFANTSGGAFTMNLPAGTAGNIVSVVDYTNTFQTNALTIAANGSQKIGGVQATVDLSTEGQSVTFVYVDDTEGWKNVQDSTSNVIGESFITATGGTITTSGNYKIHTFTGPGTFTVCSASTVTDNNIVSYLVAAGGGGGGGSSNCFTAGGGGGAGGFREYKGPSDCYTASPLNGNPGGTAVTVSAQAYPITVGGGGSGGVDFAKGSNGSNSVFSTITSTAGGGGSSYNVPDGGSPGGSGGGGGSFATGGNANIPGGNGNTPPVSPAQGTNGGNGADVPQSSNVAGGGGGGATAAGAAGSSGVGGAGGAGATSSINGTPTARAGGGAGSSLGARPGGAGGGGSSVNGGSGTTGGAGTTNTGGGGAGAATLNSSPGSTGGAGGSGIVIIRYKFQ